MKLVIREATAADIAELLALRLAVDADQQRRFDDARWSATITAKSIARDVKSGHVLLGFSRGKMITTLRMVTKKPWAIDLNYFTPAAKAVYLHDVETLPSHQRKGASRVLMAHAADLARAAEHEVIRLDAYDGASGAAPFYKKCGYSERGRVSYRGVPLVYFELRLRPVATRQSRAPAKLQTRKPIKIR